MAKNKDKDKTSNNSPDVQEEELSEKSDSLEEENKVLSEMVKSLEEKTLRAQAEIENIRKTSQKEMVKAACKTQSIEFVRNRRKLLKMDTQ